jgi:hypothetical protein
MRHRCGSAPHARLATERSNGCGFYLGRLNAGLVFEDEGRVSITIRISRERALDVVEAVTGYLGQDDE